MIKKNVSLFIGVAHELYCALSFASNVCFVIQIIILFIKWS